MGLANYTDLQAAVASWLERTGDGTVSANTAVIVALAEARLSRELGPVLRTATVNGPLTGTIGSALLTLPTDFLVPVALWLTTFGDRTRLRQAIAGQEEISLYNGTPTSWAMNDAAIELDYPCDQAHSFVLRYRKKLALSDVAPTNWLLTAHPDVYLYASIIEAATMLQDADAVGGYEALLGPRMMSVSTTESTAITGATATVDPALLGGAPFDIRTG